MADKIVDRKENVQIPENTIVSLLDNTDNGKFNQYKIFIKLLLEDLRRTAEHASDIAEEALNQTIGEVINIEKRPLHYRTWYKTNFDILRTIKKTNTNVLLDIAPKPSKHN